MQQQKQASIQSLLKHNDTALASIDLLAEAYLKHTGKKVNKGCRASVFEMILTLRNIYNMSNFKLIGKSQYKIKKSDRFTISNSNLTDDLAIAFLKERKERIELFEKYPENWEELLKDGNIAIEAERLALKESLEEMTLAELKEKYPAIKEKKKALFISKILS